MKEIDNYFLEFHKDMMEQPEMPHCGLCASVDEEYSDIIAEFRPEGEERVQLVDEGYSLLYWGSGRLANDSRRRVEYTPLRQTIVLFAHHLLNDEDETKS